MKTRLHIVASCADRKRLPIAKELRLGSHRDRGRVSRLDSFLIALGRANGDTLPAADLYAGPYWAVVRELPAAAAGAGVQATLWVASAGYGLVPATAPLRGYSATFRLGEPDSVASGLESDPVSTQLAAWWQGLAAWKGPSPGRPRCVSDLAAAEPRSHVMVLGSPRYIQALEDDLGSAVSILRERLLIVTSLAPGKGNPLAGNVIASEERLLSVVEGARPALHARVARHIIAESPRYGLAADTVRGRLRSLADRSSYRRPPERAPMNDEQVRAFIRRALRTQRELSCTRALRSLRDGGRACEQKRFRELYQEVVNGHA